MSDWNPSLYLHFSAERSRPAVELLARVPLENVEYVADLGCGPGNSTALLQQRWPAARITGIDSSPAMIAEARSAWGRLRERAKSYAKALANDILR